jgi:hypothetical protein
MNVADLDPDTEPMPPETEAKLTIRNPMPSVPDSNLGIESL